MNNGEANYWEKVSRALDVRIRAPSTVKIGNASFVADAHFLDFGGQHGMLVFHEFSDFQTQSQLLVDKGYGVTSLPRRMIPKRWTCPHGEKHSLTGAGLETKWIGPIG